METTTMTLIDKSETVTLQNGDQTITLTIKHPACVHNIPVMLIGDKVYQPGDAIQPDENDDLAFLGAEDSTIAVLAAVRAQEQSEADKYYKSTFPHDEYARVKKYREIFTNGEPVRILLADVFIYHAEAKAGTL